MAHLANRFLVPVLWLALGIDASVTRTAVAQDDGSGYDASRVPLLVSQAQSQVDDAVGVVAMMAHDAHILQRLARAKAVLIVPRYREGAALVGGGGGTGVMLARRGGGWTDPAFYSLRGVSIGLQVGGASGPLALLLMSDQAVDAFETNTSTWTANGGAGLAVASYARASREALGRSDLIIWSGVRGLFGGVSFGAVDVAPSDAENHAYYRSPVAPLQILIGAARNPRSRPLRDALQMRLVSRDSPAPIM